MIDDLREEVAQVAQLARTLAVVETRQQDVLRRLSDVEGRRR